MVTYLNDLTRRRLINSAAEGRIIMQLQICALCKASFELSDADLAFYEKIEVPPPKCCPRDRLRRRLAFRNERNLFKRKCDKSGAEIISNLRPDAPVPVFSLEEWHKDNWDAPQAQYDFGAPFFQQFAKLAKKSPHMHKLSGGNEVNSPYINHAGNCRNCYYIFNSEYDEDCMYLRFGDHCRDCVDCSNIFNSELCYECVNVEHCYRCFFSDDCKNCLESYFLRFCRGVKNSIFCYGLEQKQYHIFNEPHTKEKFEDKVRSLKLHTFGGLEQAKKIWKEYSAQFPLRRKIIVSCENSTGDALYNSKNARDCYNCTRIQDSRYVLNSVDVKDSHDIYAYGEAELCYELVTLFKVYNNKLCYSCLQGDHLEYCGYCFGCHYCFGCAGIHGKSYCIFNKQYSKEEYFDTVKRIKAHMTRTGEYGEFFPIELSPFPYEDSMANDYFPSAEKLKSVLPSNAADVATMPTDASFVDADALSQKIFACPVTGAPFKLQKREIEFYKKMGVALPRSSFEARYLQRNRLVPFPY